jgi:hypothetical protein
LADQNKAGIRVNALVSQIVTKRIGGTPEQRNKLEPHVASEVDVSISYQEKMDV